MNIRRICYISDFSIGLMEYLNIDEYLDYENWLDIDMQKNYNYIPKWKSFNEYSTFYSIKEKKARFLATIIKLDDCTPIGKIKIAPIGMEPDISLCIFKRYRGVGYGTNSLRLALEYIFNKIKLKYVVAGVYEQNLTCQNILTKMGFSREYIPVEDEINCFTGKKIIQIPYKLTNYNYFQRNNS